MPFSNGLRRPGSMCKNTSSPLRISLADGQHSWYDEAVLVCTNIDSKKKGLPMSKELPLTQMTASAG